MGACTSKTKKNKEKHLKSDVTNGGNNNHNQKNSIAEQIQDRHSSSANVDQFANVPFIDSEDKVTATNAAAAAAPKATPETPIPTETVDNDDEKTTVKTNFETNVTYSSAETIDKLKKEVYGFLKEKILPIKEEKEKLFDYIHKRCQTNPTDSSPSTNIDDCLEECFHEIEQGQHPDQENGKPFKKRLMNIITIYVASQSADNSFLKALYDKLGPSLDLNSLNAETSEHEVVNITVTKTVRQVFLDGSSTVLPPNHSTTTTNQNGTTNDTHIENNECNIPADLPDDIRLKAEQVLNSFNDALHNKQN